MRILKKARGIIVPSTGDLILEAKPSNVICNLISFSWAKLKGNTPNRRSKIHIICQEAQSWNLVGKEGRNGEVMRAKVEQCEDG
jgi:hypothetical protein